jgi:hypothetical protein
MCEARCIVEIPPTDANPSLLEVACLLGILDTHTNPFGGNEFEQVLDNGSAELAISSSNDDHDNLLLLFDLLIVIFFQGLTVVFMCCYIVN